jgi:RNA polymerase sigma factor (sigma-70 family)
MRELDPSIINKAGAGDRAAQYELYKWCYPVLMSIAVRYRPTNREDAADLMNQGFIKIVDGIPKYTPDKPFVAWIRRIMVNVSIDDYRKNSRERKGTQLVDDWAPVQGQVTQFAQNDGEAELSAEYLQRLIARLSPTTRQVFNLFALEGFSHREIGDKLGISEGTSKWHLSDARSRLKQMISPTLINKSL